TFDLDAAEEAGLKHEARIGEPGTRTQCACCLINSILREIKRSREFRLVAISKPHTDFETTAALLEDVSAFPRCLGVIQQTALINVEIEIDRIERDDRRELRLIRLYKVASGNQMTIDPSTERCGDLAVSEVELRPFDTCL